MDQIKRRYCLTVDAPAQTTGHCSSPKRVKFDLDEDIKRRVETTTSEEEIEQVAVASSFSKAQLQQQPKSQMNTSKNSLLQQPQEPKKSSDPVQKKEKGILDFYCIPASRIEDMTDEDSNGFSGNDDYDNASKRERVPFANDRKLVYKILSAVYKRTVTPNIDVLETYKPWSPQVYGELKRNLIHDIIQKTALTQNSIFLDFGCGVGNVILQVAAEAGCSVYGIEFNRERYEMAINQLDEFRNKMRRYEVPHGEVTVYHADFLNCPPINAILSKNQKVVVLVNNFMFEEETRLSLLQLFLQLEDRGQIVSLKSFRLGRHKINGWNSGDIANILRVDEHPYGKGWVSWSASEGKYFVATVDRSILREWEEKQMNGFIGLETRVTRSSRRSKID
ncbi:12193_t:CDS:2 [Ambispora gerdemannii]|uniref:Histone-lysine N-methyltransferase, H3 lysine-79 specific n=1 Tax=Ambispora gerdemannii TaxID=144530 RepID=A0A9N8ZQQ9_9GLOM|nr:12193_t:CDS:2 [Ambispora gerdemannii]